MKIKITEKNRDKIESELLKVNGRAESFTITKFNEVESVAKRAENILYYVPVKERKGAKFLYRPAGATANSYKYAAKTTTLELERTSTGWFLTNISEYHVYPKTLETRIMKISQEQADIIAKKALEYFVVV